MEISRAFCGVLCVRYAYYFLVIYCNTKLPSQGARLCKWLHSELSVTNHKKLAETLNSQHIPDSIDEEGRRKQTPTWIKMCFEVVASNAILKVLHIYIPIISVLLYLIIVIRIQAWFNLWLPWSYYNTIVKLWILCKN